MRQYWINVISKDHVQRGIHEGITQSGHGREAPLRKMKKGDGIIFYSPKQSLDGNEKLQAFTALGEIADDTIYQVTLSTDFAPFRRKVTFRKTKDVPIAPLLDHLSFITDKTHWGYIFRFGLFAIIKDDFDLIANAMTTQ